MRIFDLIVGRATLNKKGRPNVVVYLADPAKRVSWDTRSNLDNSNLGSLQSLPNITPIACLRAGNAGASVKKQLPGDVSKAAHVLEVGKHERCCIAQKLPDRHENWLQKSYKAKITPIMFGMFPFASYFTKRVILIKA